MGPVQGSGHCRLAACVGTHLGCGGGDLALISAHILSENMSNSNSEACRGDAAARNAAQEVGL